MLERLLLAIMWLLHFLPLPLLAPAGRGLGTLLYALGRERREVALTNLRLCFPHLGEAQRSRLAMAHFRVFGRSFLERGLCLWASPSRIRRVVRLEGMDRLDSLKGRPVILLAPHFVGLDVGWTRLCMERQMAGMYAMQKSAYLNEVLLRSRGRFGPPVGFSRQDGMRRAIRVIREGIPFYYLPDMDYGARDTIFVPFFGVAAATITGLSRLSRRCGAVVLPCVTRMDDRGYTVTLHEPWADYPGDSIEADTRRMNAWIEQQVRAMPEQYYWLHKRFKTRPPGEPKLY